MIEDFYQCGTKGCWNVVVINENQHDFNPLCPKCSRIVKYIESYEYDDATHQKIRTWKDPKKINYDLEAASREWDEKYGKFEKKTPVCPTCGSTNLEKIGTLGRMVSIGLFGLASNKFGKSFKCRSCGYTW